MLDQDQNPAEALVDVTPAAPPLPAAPRSRRRLWLTLAALGVAAVTTAAVALADNIAAFGEYRYEQPGEFLGLPGVPVDQVVKASPQLRDVKVGGYQAADKSRSVVLTVRELPTLAPSGQIDSVISEATRNLPVADLHEIDPGPRGGVLKCGHTTAIRKAGKAQDVGFCAWVDGSMWAVYVEHIEDVTITAEKLADDVRAFRELAEVKA
ncbi:hypothetical protein [Kitasatospora sp. NPDC048538]|uniref:hypothetical protein n=1 Tax=unclassified Kitasatospora TaxID=2633591 RepID=UPI0033FB749B